MSGLRIQAPRSVCLEDFRIEQRIAHRCGRTLHDGLVAEFANRQFTSNVFCLNRSVAGRAGLGDRVVPPTLLLCLALGQSAADLERGARATPGIRRVDIGGPVIIGDTVEMHSTIVGLQQDSDHRSSGLLTVCTEVLNQRQETVMTVLRGIRLWKRNPTATIQEGICHLDLAEPTPAIPLTEKLRGIWEMDTTRNGWFESFTPGETRSDDISCGLTASHVRLSDMVDYGTAVYSQRRPGTASARHPMPPIAPPVLLSLATGLLDRQYGNRAITTLQYRGVRFFDHAYPDEQLVCRSRVLQCEAYEGGADLGIVRVSAEVFVPGTTPDADRRIQHFQIAYLLPKRAYYDNDPR